MKLKKKNYELNFPIFLTQSHFLALSSRVSCFNSLTSPTVPLWPIHDHSQKYLYQHAPTCEQKPIGKKQHIDEIKTHQTKMVDFNQTRSRLSIYRAKCTPCQKAFLKTTEHSWRTQYVAGDVGEKCLMNKLIRIEWVKAIRSPSSAYTHGWRNMRHPWAKNETYSFENVFSSYRTEVHFHAKNSCSYEIF